MTDNFALGELTLIITGKYLPLRARPESEKNALARELANHLARMLNTELHAYEGEFRVEVVAITDGCIRVKLKLWWKTLNEFSTKNFAFPAMLISVSTLIANSYPVEQKDYPTHTVSLECKIQRGETNIASGAVLIEEGKSLYAALKDRPRDGYSLNQLLVATFQHNPYCFPEGDINNVKAGSVLLIPGTKAIRQVPEHYADRVVGKGFSDG